MTEKELKKLSRLELLEILLEGTKENEKLRAKLENANDIIKNATILSEFIDKMNDTLGQAQGFTTKLCQITEDMSAVRSQVQSLCVSQGQPGEKAFPVHSKENKPAKSADAANSISDKNLYVGILNYYLANDSALSALPDDLQNDIRARLKSILESKK